jgi:hypothetical protein
MEISGRCLIVSILGISFEGQENPRSTSFRIVNFQVEIQTEFFPDTPSKLLGQELP